jgi:hypothetical protein
MLICTILLYVWVLDIIYGLVTKKIAVGNLRKIIVTLKEDNRTDQPCGWVILDNNRLELARNQDDVSEWRDMSTCEKVFFFSKLALLKIQLSE